MFKLTGRSGRRNASAGGQGTSRVSGLHSVVGRQIQDEQRRRPAFMPDTPQESTRDYTGPRVSEPGDRG